MNLYWLIRFVPFCDPARPVIFAGGMINFDFYQ